MSFLDGKVVERNRRVYAVNVMITIIIRSLSNFIE